MTQLPPEEHSLTGSLDPQEPEGPPEIVPLNLSAMGRLFGVPLMIIAVIIGGAIAVVLLFGAPSTPEQRDISKLLSVLEAGSGEASMGILLPREKELWQTALELSERLENKNGELSDEQLQEVARRLIRVIETDLAHLERLPTFDERRGEHLAVRSKRLEFAIHALGRTSRPEAVEPLIGIVNKGPENYVAVAMQQLGNLHGLSESKQSIPALVAVLSRESSAVTKMTASTALSVLAEPGDSKVCEALTAHLHAHEGEVAWSAALALGRLGCPSGKSTLLELLDRAFWESGERYQVTDSSGTVHRYPMPPNRVEQYLFAAMDSASRLDDSDLWEIIERLTSDPSAAVRSRAKELIERKRSGLVPTTQ